MSGAPVWGRPAPGWTPAWLTTRMILPIHLSHASSNSFSSSSSCSFGVSFFRLSYFSSSASRRSRARSACVLRFASVIRANVVLGWR